jgi:hypothetical protein
MSDLQERQDIGARMVRRCTNCFHALPGGQVHGTGWHWIDGNVGPFCDDCWAIITKWMQAHVTTAMERTINDLIERYP